LKQGFKQTDIGVIPTDWKVEPISEIALVRTGPFGSSLHESDYVREGTPIITVEHLGEQGIAHIDTPMVSDYDNYRLRRYTLILNDIVFSRVGSVDRNSLVKKTEEGWLFSGRLLRIRIKDKRVHPPFLSYFFKTENFKNRIRSVAVGQTMASLNTQIINNIEIFFPPLPEQHAISEALSDMDALIAAQEALIAKKRAIKQGVMQELLTGKRRLPGFNGEWKEKSIGELLDYEQPTKYIVNSTEYAPNNEVPVLTANKSFILGYTDEIHGIYENVPVIIFDDFTTDKKYVNFPFKVKSSGMKILRQKHKFVDLRFVYEKMQLIDFVIGDHKRYYISEYQHIKISIPVLSEQNAISAIITTIETEIKTLEKKLEKIKLLKQGMMQELLTGRIRLM